MNDVILREMNQAACLIGQALPILSKEFLDGRLGGYLAFCEPNGLEAMKVHLGQQERDKREASYGFVTEKHQRLHVHPKHVLSHQSRAPENVQFGGAVRLPSDALILPDWMVSFSGLREVDDTMINLATANARSLISDDQMHRLAEPMYGMLEEGQRFPLGKVTEIMRSLAA